MAFPYTSLFRSLQLAVFLHFPQQDQAKSQYQQVPGGFRTMVKLIERPRQKGEQIPYDPGEDHRVAKGRQYPLPCVFEREHSLPDQHKHHRSEQYIAEEIGGQHRSGVSKKDPVGNVSRRPDIAVLLKGELEDQRHIHEHGVDIRPADRAGKISRPERLDPLLLFRRGTVQFQELVHLMKANIVQRRAEDAAEDADHHAPNVHIQVSNAHHQTDRIGALALACLCIQKIADHIEQAADHSECQRAFFSIYFHMFPPNPILTICIFNLLSPTLAEKRN